VTNRLNAKDNKKTIQKGNTSALTKSSSELWIAQGDPHEVSEVHVSCVWLFCGVVEFGAATRTGCWGGERLNEAVEQWSRLRLLL
jgi:hypothetical protein